MQKTIRNAPPAPLEPGDQSAPGTPGSGENLCPACQKPLWVKYDLDALKKNFPKKELFGRPPTMWRYLEMLPVRNPDRIVSLTETITPILETKRLAAHFGVERLYVKDESRLPTGSFKARGMAMAISMANGFGTKRVACPTAGNAGGAMAAYAARAGMGAVMNRLTHVMDNLTSISTNTTASRSQIEDADYAQASTQLARSQIIQQAATAVLAQANVSQQTVLKLLQQ